MLRSRNNRSKYSHNRWSEARDWSLKINYTAVSAVRGRGRDSGGICGNSFDVVELSVNVTILVLLGSA